MLIALLILIGNITYAQTVINAIPTLSYPSGLCWDGTYLWYGRYGTTVTDSIYKIDPTNGNILKRFRWRPAGWTSGSCYGLAFDTTNNGSLWVSTQVSGTPTPNDTIFHIDTITGGRIGAVRTQKEYMAGLANDGQNLWHCVYYSPDGRVYKLNKTTGAATDSIDIPSIPQPWGATWDGQYLWVCNDSGSSSGFQGTSRAYKINVVTKQIIDSTKSPGIHPRGLAWDGTYLWIAAMMSGSPSGWGLYQIDLGGGGTPDIYISPTTYNYGYVPFDTISSFPLTISNVGTDTLTIDTIFSQNPVFYYSSVTFPIILAPTQNTIINVIFGPTTLQYYTANLGISSDDPDEETVYVALRGQGVYPDPTLSPGSTSYNYGDVRVNCFSDWLLRIVNQGYPILSIDSIKFTDARFFNQSITFPISLNCLETTYVQVITKPNSLGGYSGDMQIYSNSLPSPVTLSLSANGTLNNALGGDLLWEYDIPNRVRCVAQIADINNDGISDVAADADINGLKHLKTFLANSDNTGVVQWAVGDNDFTSGYGDECLIQGMDYNSDGVSDVLLGTAWGDRTVYAIDAKTGSIIWFYDSHVYDGEGGWVYSIKPMQDINGDGIGEVLAGIGGNSTPGGGPRSMYCFSGANGNIIWQFRTGIDGVGSVAWIPDVNNDGVTDAICGAYGNGYDKKVYCVSGASSGLVTTPLWQYYCGGDVQSIITIPDINGDGKFDVVAGSWSDSVFGLSGANGQRLWATNIGSIVVKVTAIPDLIGPDRPGIAVACWGNVFNVLDCRGGNVYWNYAIGSSTWTADAIRDVNNDGTLDVITGNQTPGTVYCFSGVDGSILWTYSVGKMIYSIRAINDVSFDGNQDVLVGTQVSGNVAKVMAICGGNYTPSQYYITASAYGPGTIIPYGTVVILPGSDTTFIISANPVAELESLIVDGENHGADSTYFTFEDVSTNHSIIAYFSPNIYTITATASIGGMITPSGEVIVNEGSDTTFTITADLGHHLDSLIVDGITHGADSTSYTFEDVDNDHTIDAYFSINTFTILATATSGGTITPSDSVIVNYGEDTTFTIAANTDYQLDSVLVDDVSVGPETLYTFNDVDTNHTIHAIFSMTALPGWTQKESLPPLVKDGGALVGVTGSKDGDLLFAFRGAKSKEFYMYNGTWTAKETIPFGYKYPLTEPPAINKKVPGKGAALCYDGVNTIYATKGNGTYEFWAYDLTSDAGWTAKAFVPSTQKLKGGTSMAYYEGKVYLLAGAQKKDNLNNFFVYNPAADSDLGTPWTALSGTPITPPVTGKAKPFKDGSCLSIIGNTIYALKGGDKYNFFYAYDIATDIWTELETIPLVHSDLGKKNKVGDGGAMTTDGSILYVIKGKGKQDFWSYNPISEGVWTSLDTIPRKGEAFKKSVPKTGAGLAYANGKVWLLKGNKTPEFWCYVPGGEKSKVISQKSKVSIQENLLTPRYSLLATSFDVTPNPFTKLTTIRYTVPISGKVSLKLYNATGRLIETLQDGYLSSGIYSMNLSDIIKGIYFLKYESNTNKSEVKLIVQ